MRIACSGTILVKATLEENLRLIHDLGFREIDLLLVTDWAHVNLNELAADYGRVSGEIKRLLNKYAIRCAAVNAKYSVRLEDADADSAAQRQRELDAMLRLMGELGVQRVSIQPTLTTDAAYLARTFDASAREAMRQQEYVAARGMKMSLEPHIMSSVCTNAGIEKVLARYPDFSFTYDPSHLLHSGETMRSTGYLMKNANMVHLRDARKGALFVMDGEGDLDLPYAIGGLKEVGYDGPIALEYLGDSYDEKVCEDLIKFADRVNALIQER